MLKIELVIDVKCVDELFESSYLGDMVSEIILSHKCISWNAVEVNK